MAGDGEDRAGASDRERRLLLTHASHDALLDALLPAQHAVYVKDRGGRYLTVNAAGAANLGYAPDQLVGKTDVEIFSGQLGERLWRSDQQIMSAGQARTVQEPVLVDGKLRTYLTTKAPLRDASGIVVGLVGASYDASSLTDLDEQLRRREAQLAEAQALTLVGSWEYDVRSGEQSWSDEVYRIVGRDPSQFAPTFDAVVECVHPEDRRRLTDEVRRAMAPGSDGRYALEHRIVRPDGEQRVCRCRGRVFFDLDGTPLRMVGAVQDVTDDRNPADLERDVTERKLAEASLADGDRHTRQILETAHEAFVAIDAAGVITDWNSAAELTFGWSRDEALGRELAATIIPESHRAAHRSGLARFVATGEARILGKRLELLALHRDGHEFPVELTIAPLQTDSGYAFNAFLRDVSERRASEQEIRRGRALSERLLRAQDAISRVFAQAQSSDEAMRALLAALGQSMGWQLGAWWSRGGDELLRCRSVWHREDRAEEFETASMQLELARGDAPLPARAWASGQPVWTADLATDARFPRAGAAGRAGLHASVCVPVLADREFRGAIEFFSAHTGEPDVATRQILRTVAEQIGGFMSVLDQRAELIAKLQLLALTDELTGLANRRAWQESLEREVARARRQDEPLCVAMLDLDHFKDFNDTHGHQSGDQLLRELADTWRAQLRASDILARYGGEEFSLAFRASPLHTAATVLARVRAAVPRQQTCSAGLAQFDGSESTEDLVGRADAALYHAKAQGRDRTVIDSGT